jgi:predicted RND superfamily exporter protein
MNVQLDPSIVTVSAITTPVICFLIRVVAAAPQLLLSFVAVGLSVYAAFGDFQWSPWLTGMSVLLTVIFLGMSYNYNLHKENVDDCNPNPRLSIISVLLSLI